MSKPDLSKLSDLPSEQLHTTIRSSKTEKFILIVNCLVNNLLEGL